MADKQAPAERVTLPRPLRDVSGRFVPGFSGNPAGRPVILAEVRAAARASALESVSTLACIRDDTRAAYQVRAAAADRLLQWAFGGPAGLASDQRDLSQLTDAELDALDAENAAQEAAAAEDAALAEGYDAPIDGTAEDPAIER